MSDRNLRLCPVCSGVGRSLIHRQRFMEGPLGDGYDVVVCTQCGFGFADGIPTQADMDRHYTEHSKYSYDHADGAESSWDMRRFEATADQIIPFLRSRDVRILDIGCATGGLLSVFKRRGYCNLMGADPSPSCAAAASRLHAIKVRTSTLRQLGDWDERFDLILMVGVLEHLSEVKAAVKSASRLLSAGGLFYAAVPDVEQLAACPNAPYQQFSTEHVNFFSIASLRRLMADCNLTQRCAWNWTIEWRQGVWEPIASGLYEHGGSTKLNFDSSTKPALERYLAFSQKGDSRIQDVLNSLVASQEQIIVWGAGTLTRRLLKTGQLANVNIAAFVDSNPHFQDQLLAGRPILKPKDLINRRESILVCSISFLAEIAIAARKQYNLQNRLFSIQGDVL